MDLDMYQEYVMGGQKLPPSNPEQRKDLFRSQRFLNAVLGMCGEAGEVANKCKWDKKNPPDENDIADELGDVFWYLTCCAGQMGISLSELATINYRKLSVRYPTMYPPRAL